MAIFDFMAELVNQITDDTLREQLEEALGRCLPEDPSEISHSS
jgi:hypothetical protein